MRKKSRELKNDLLALIIREYVALAEPVGSAYLCRKYDLNFSPATVRQRMVDLEKEGFIFQPHTSAGRVPTEKGYHYYLNHCLKKEDVFKLIQELKELNLKQLAKALASYLEEGVFIGFSPQEIFYTGLSYLFSQPEFRTYKFVYEMSKIFDMFDEVISCLFEKYDDNDDLVVLIGKENPFNENCATVFFKKKIIFGVLGPKRMNYDKVISVMSELRGLIEQKVREENI